MKDGADDLYIVVLPALMLSVVLFPPSVNITLTKGYNMEPFVKIEEPSEIKLHGEPSSR